jgi:hypothetical protein
MRAPRTGLAEYLLGGGVRYPSRYRWLELAGVVVYFCYVGKLVARVGVAMWTTPALCALLVPIALLALLAADFVSGFVHFLADTYASEQAPFLGPKLIQPFRQHHRDPEAITRHDFVEANGDNCLVTLLVLVPFDLGVTVLWPAGSDLGAAALLVAFVAVFSLGILLTSIVHGWAHTRDRPWYARALAHARLVISPEAHQGHHDGRFRSHYCITTGWLNGPLDRVDFYGRVERLLRRWGVEPDVPR